MTQTAEKERPKIYGIYEEFFDERGKMTKRLIKEGYAIIRDRRRVYAILKETHNDAK